jgi:hypothetical protein
MITLWYAGSFIAAVSLGWLAASVHATGFAPIGLLSLAFGVLFGIMVTALAGLAGIRCRTRLIIGTVVLALITVFAEHAWLYREFRRQWHEARASSAELAMFRPETPSSPSEYFARELAAGRGPLWVLDALLIMLAATTTMLIARRSMAGWHTASGVAKLSEP